MLISHIGWYDELEERLSLVVFKLFDSLCPRLEDLVLAQVIPIVEDSETCRNLTSLELVSDDGVKNVLASEIKRSSNTPCVREGKNAFHVLLLYFVVALETFFERKE